MNHLDDMQLFVELVQTRHFGRAADNLGISKSTLSVRIAKLERALGLRLLNRSTRTLELTEAGAVYFERAYPLVQEAKQVHLALDELVSQPVGYVRVSVPVEFAQIFIAPLMAEFAERYPLIEFDFFLTPHKVDLISEPFDLAIRIGRQSDSGLTSRLLAEVGGSVYAAPAYLARHGTPQTPAELSTHQCLRFRHGFNENWRLYNGKTAVDVAIKGKMQTNSPGMNRELAVAGVGITLLPELVVRECVAQGRLVHILPEWYCDTVPVYAITAARLIPKKTQVLLEFLKEKLAA